MDGSMVFARLRQCATHLIILYWAHSSPNPKRHLHRFSRFCTAHGRASLYFTMDRPFPLKIAPSHREIWTPSNAWFLRPIPAQSPNGILNGSIIFAQLTTECFYTLQWAALPPQNCLLPCGDLDSHLIHGSLGPSHPSFQPKRHFDRFSRICMAHYCDRQTDR